MAADNADTLAAWLHVAATFPDGQSVMQLGLQALGLTAPPDAVAAAVAAAVDAVGVEGVDGLVRNLDRLAFADASNTPPANASKATRGTKKGTRRSRCGLSYACCHTRV